MDFRATSTDDFRIEPARRGGGTTTCPAIVVQTPPCRVAVVPGPGRYTLRLYLDTDIGREFAQFLERVEDRFVSHHDGLDKSAAVWNDSFKMTAFDGCEFFDVAGECVSDPMAMKACAALLELVGTWTFNGRWGLRWRVVQVKAMPPPRQKKPEMMFLDDSAMGPSAVGPSAMGPSAVGPSAVGPSAVGPSSRCSMMFLDDDL